MTMPEGGSTSGTNVQELAASITSPARYQIKRDKEFAEFFIKELEDLVDNQRHVSTYIPLDPLISESSDQIEKYLNAPHYGRNQSKHPLVKIIYANPNYG